MAGAKTLRGEVEQHGAGVWEMGGTQEPKTVVGACLVFQSLKACVQCSI